MKEYYQLVKPGIVYGNALSALAAFLFASHRQPDWKMLGLTLVGLSAVIAASCVINNVIDRDIDANMERTKNRPLVTGAVSVRNALLFAAVLAVIGVIALWLVNYLALFVALFGVGVYLLLYTPLKRVSMHSTVVGALAGAVPPVVGYVAVIGALDAVALCLFLILVTWQMAHFFAIAIYRKDDYAAAALPIASVYLGIPRTKALLFLYTLLFAGSVGTLTLAAHLGALYVVPLSVLAAGWVALAAANLLPGDDRRRARALFFYSLVVLLAFCLFLALS